MATKDEKPERTALSVQAADRFGVITDTIRRYLRQGRLQGFRVGPHAVRIPASELGKVVEPITITPATVHPVGCVRDG